MVWALRSGRISRSGIRFKRMRPRLRRGIWNRGRIRAGGVECNLFHGVQISARTEASDASLRCGRWSVCI